jgi:thiol-disulfide isomerase/thioredoxin
MSPVTKKKSFWIGIIAFFLLAWVAHTTYRALSIQQENETYRTLSVGEEFPANTPLVGLDGKYKSLGDFKGKVVLINYWAAWCGPCLKEMPSLYQLQKKLADKNFVVIGISMDDDLGQGMATLERIAGKAPFEMFKGAEQAIFHKFPIEGLPFTAILDKQGKIAYAEPGERNWLEEEAVKMIEALL